MTYSTNTFTASKGGGSGQVNQGAVQSSEYTDSGTTPGSGGQILREGSTHYDTSSSRVEQLQRGDVTEQIRQYNNLYGGSDNTQAGGLAASKSLVYAPAPTIQQAQRVSTTVAPFTFRLVGQIGLFGAENYYVRISTDVITSLDDDFTINDYQEGVVEQSGDIPFNTYEPAQLDFDRDPPPPDPQPGAQQPPEKQADRFCCAFLGGTPSDPVLNCYYGAKISEGLPLLFDPVISIRYVNIGTGNIYIDNWLEPMMYTREREMWGYDVMYIRPKDFFFFGLHARNTRHLPYNVDIIIGEEIISSAEVADQRLIATNTIGY